MKIMKKKAQSLIEYGLILALVAVIAVTVLAKFGGTMSDTANTVDTKVQSAANNASGAYCKSIHKVLDPATNLCKDE